MIIISHRGYWKSVEEKNTSVAFKRSFKLNFGTETDVRDCCGNLMISHDAPNGSEMLLEEFLDIYSNCNLPLAINVKADGLAKKLKTIFNSRNLKNWFVFDMSIPDTKSHLIENNPVYMRLSEHELNPPWLDIATGVWLDSFESTWYDTDFIKNLLNTNKMVCVVSAELHNRDETEQWEIIKPLMHYQNLMICTDKPEHAKNYFNGESN